MHGAYRRLQQDPTCSQDRLKAYYAHRARQYRSGQMEANFGSGMRVCGHTDALSARVNVGEAFRKDTFRLVDQVHDLAGELRHLPRGVGVGLAVPVVQEVVPLTARAGAASVEAAASHRFGFFGIFTSDWMTSASCLSWIS